MKQEIDLLVNYPKTKRDLKQRGNEKTKEDRAVARQFSEAFFDGDRRHGYGGFTYNPRFWQPVVPTFQKHFGLTASSRLLDVGSAKGFMLHDIQQLIPGITVKGVDISDYAVANTMESVRDQVSVANANDLPFDTNSFDVVISINTIHNLEQSECGKALQEIERVSQQHSFITVDAYRTDEEYERMQAWNLTAKTIMHVDEWKTFFDDVGYTGDYFWFIP